MQETINSGGNALASPGRSLHELGRAVDINGVTPEIVQAMADAGLDWGGNFKPKPDRPHFYDDPFPGKPDDRRDPIERLRDWWKRCAHK